MKDPDIPIVQNEAAIMTTMAAELFLKSLAKQSHRNENRGRNTIRYEDVAEARTNSSLGVGFLGNPYREGNARG
jgi:histone H3/H4